MTERPTIQDIEDKLISLLQPLIETHNCEVRPYTEDFMSANYANTRNQLYIGFTGYNKTTPETRLALQATAITSVTEYNFEVLVVATNLRASNKQGVYGIIEGVSRQLAGVRLWPSLGPLHIANAAYIKRNKQLQWIYSVGLFYSQKDSTIVRDV